VFGSEKKIRREKRETEDNQRKMKETGKRESVNYFESTKISLN
jgi:hypothetical protein